MGWPSGDGPGDLLDPICTIFYGFCEGKQRVFTGENWGFSMGFSHDSGDHPSEIGSNDTEGRERPSLIASHCLRPSGKLT